MKKFLTMLLALVMVLSLAACSSQKGGDVNGGFPRQRRGPADRRVERLSRKREVLRGGRQPG